MVFIFTKITGILFDQLFHQSSKVGSFYELFYGNRHYFQKVYQQNCFTSELHLPARFSGLQF
jgi:hypothetical protein